MNPSRAVCLALLASLGAIQPLMAQAVTMGGTGQWVIQGAPFATTLGGSPFIQATYENHVNATVLGVGIIVLRNHSGESVFCGAATASIAYAQYESLYFDLTAAPSGSFQATVFVMDVAGVAISNSTTVSVTT